MTKSCLVTGGAGFIGCALLPALCNQFDRVLVVDSLIGQVHPERRKPAEFDARAELFIGDVSNEATWHDAIGSTKFDAVIHLAAETGTGQSLTHSTLHATTNTVGTTQLLDHFSRIGSLPEKIILASSRAVYGEGQWAEAKGASTIYPGQRTKLQLGQSIWDFPGLAYLPCQAGVTAPNPVSVYGATKLSQENIVSAWANAFGIEACILRFQNVYGEGQSLSNPYTGIVSLFCRIAREGQSIPLFEDGAMLRDFIHISDVKSAILAALGKGSSGIYDIGTGRSETVSDLAHVIASHYDAPKPHICGKFRFGDVRHASCLTTWTSADLGWQAKVPMAEGCRRLAAWIEERLG